ncbi:MAG: hypothetical protein ACLP8S_24900 [Solirubrobacteraceae bacterium]
MFGDEGSDERFEELLRSIAREVGRSMERVQEDLDEIAGAIGVDPTRAKEWVDGAVGWLRGHAEGLGDDLPPRGARTEDAMRGARTEDSTRGTEDSTRGTEDSTRGTEDATRGTEDATRGAPAGARAPEDERPSRGGPHPLDLPSAAQGAGLAALDSGRWTVEPGSHALVAQDAGPVPDDAQGLVEELRARDWIAADGEVTLSGRHALTRWLAAAGPQ